MVVSFKTSRDDMDIIGKIVKRANGGITLAMDLDACNSNGCPLDFGKLLAFDDFNFWHDIGGIQRFIDRNTGWIGGCFSPRCSKGE